MARAVIQSDLNRLGEWASRNVSKFITKCQVLHLGRRPLVMAGEQVYWKGAEDLGRQEAECEPSLCPGRKGQKHLGLRGRIDSRAREMINPHYWALRWHPDPVVRYWVPQYKTHKLESIQWRTTKMLWWLEHLPCEGKLRDWCFWAWRRGGFEDTYQFFKPTRWTLRKLSHDPL